MKQVSLQMHRDLFLMAPLIDEGPQCLAVNNQQMPSTSVTQTSKQSNEKLYQRSKVVRNSAVALLSCSCNQLLRFMRVVTTTKIMQLLEMGKAFNYEEIIFKFEYHLPYYSF